MVRRFARFGCNDSEIADLVGVSNDTIQRRFGPILREARAHRKLVLRYLQFRNARNGNAALQIWLGKNELGQSDVARIEIEIKTRVEQAAKKFGITPEEFVALATSIAKKGEK